MSNLLEQAIIDATALREVALKSAEANLIEKYSKEFKESVEKLLCIFRGNMLRKNPIDN